MVSVPTPSSLNPYAAKGLCRIVGLTCLAGFLLDMLTIALPPSAGAAWRVGVLQQMGDRSIVLLFGMALVIYSCWEHRPQRKQLAYVCLAIGVFFQICCLLVIRDSLILQERAVETIDIRAEEIQAEIDAGRNNPEVLGDLTLEQLEEIAQQLRIEADSLKQSTRSDITKVSIASIGNLVIVGLGLIGLGRAGMRSRKSKAIPSS
jgi:hypothetical protein